LHRPGAAGQVRLGGELADIHKPGMQLLRALLDAAIANPEIKPARLAQSLEEHPDGGSHLHALLTQTHPLDDDSNPEASPLWGAQLQDTLDRIVLEDLERRFGELTEKANQGLSNAEKTEFRNLQQKLAGQDPDATTDNEPSAD